MYRRSSLGLIGALEEDLALGKFPAGLDLDRNFLGLKDGDPSCELISNDLASSLLALHVRIFLLTGPLPFGENQVLHGLGAPGGSGVSGRFEFELLLGEEVGRTGWDEALCTRAGGRLDANEFEELEESDCFPVLPL